MLPRTTSIWQHDSQSKASGRSGAVHPSSAETSEGISLGTRAIYANSNRGVSERLGASWYPNEIGNWLASRGKSQPVGYSAAASALRLRGADFAAGASASGCAASVVSALGLRPRPILLAIARRASEYVGATIG
jgi:hypothetical protein